MDGMSSERLAAGPGVVEGAAGVEERDSSDSAGTEVAFTVPLFIMSSGSSHCASYKRPTKKGELQTKEFTMSQSSDGKEISLASSLSF